MKKTNLKLSSCKIFYFFNSFKNNQLNYNFQYFWFFFFFILQNNLQFIFLINIYFFKNNFIWNYFLINKLNKFLFKKFNFENKSNYIQTHFHQKKSHITNFNYNYNFFFFQNLLKKKNKIKKFKIFVFIKIFKINQLYNMFWLLFFKSRLIDHNKKIFINPITNLNLLKLNNIDLFKPLSEIEFINFKLNNVKKKLIFKNLWMFNAYFFIFNYLNNLNHRYLSKIIYTKFSYLLTKFRIKIKKLKNKNFLKKKYKLLIKPFINSNSISTKYEIQDANYKLKLLKLNKKNLNFSVYNQKNYISKLNYENYFFINNIFTIFNYIKVIKFFLITKPNQISLIYNILNKFILNTFYTYSNYFKFLNFNIIKNQKFTFFVKKNILSYSETSLLNNFSSLWNNTSIIRFLENCTGRKILIKLYPFLNNKINTYEQIRCVMWSRKLQYYQKTIGHGFFLLESLQIMYLSLKYKDSGLLINWMTTILHKISFWKHRLFFHYLRYLFKNFFWPIFSELKIKGMKFKLKGKISVAGNSRTRTIAYSIGNTSHATYENKIFHEMGLVNTFTGVLGLQLWLIF